MLLTEISMDTLLEAASVAAWGAGCYFIADFATGVIHWAEDTWLAPGRSALLDRYVIHDNLEHHARPGTIRNGSYWQTNGPSYVIGGAVAAIFAACGVFDWQVYVTVALAAHGNQIHKWAHMSDRPAIVAVLQNYGILQSRGHHGKHHTQPFAVRYCALSDFLNPVLDRIGFWRRLERVVEYFGATIQRGSPARRGL